MKPLPGLGRLEEMTRRISRTHAVVPILLILFTGVLTGWAEAPKAAATYFNRRVARVEARLAQQHRSAEDFLDNVGLGNQIDDRLRQGELFIEQLTPANEAELPGALLHHWRGTAFVPGATANDFERLMKDLGDYPHVYAPQVVRAQIVSLHGDRSADHFIAAMRVQQKHVITVVMDTTYEVTHGRLHAQHRYSMSRSTKIAEIAGAGTPRERVLGSDEEEGFLWRQNTYWSYEERDGGLYIQIESISLSRGIPAGLGWVIRPFVESVPRESLEFTLRATCRALENSQRSVRK